MPLEIFPSAMSTTSQSQREGLTNDLTAVGAKIVGGRPGAESHVSLPVHASDERGLSAIPLTIGLVGHRDLRSQDLDELRAAIETVLNKMRVTYPLSPLVLLSSLAEGADQLGAEVALEMATREALPRWQVVVRAPLPMPVDAYRESTSFASDTSRRRLDAFLADERVEAFVVPLPAAMTPLRPEAWYRVATAVDGAAMRLRSACYANAGVYVARSSHALIALWDFGDPDPARPSGTAELVRFKLTGEPPTTYPGRDSQPLGFRGERGPVVSVYTPRHRMRHVSSMKAGARELLMPPDEGKAFSLGDAPLAERVSSPRRFIDRTLSALGRSGSRKPLSKEAKAERELRQFRETCQAVEDFNHDVAEARKDIEKAIDKALGSRQADPPMLPQQAASLVRIVSMRAAAAYLARRLQPRLDQAQWTLFLLLVNAIAFFHFYAHLFEIENGHPAHQPWLLWIFLLALAVATAQVMRVWWTRLDQRRLDYRALAEALRVRRVWAIAGIDASVADSYLGQLRGEMAWARRALLHLSPPPRQWQDDFARLAESDKLRRLRCVGEDWIREQVKQFEDGHKIHHRLATVFRTGGFFVALVGWGIWLLPFVERAHPDAWIIIGSGLLVVFGGMLIAISERRSHEELAKQYERMLVVFKNGQHELAKRLAGHDISGAQAVLHALGREAITENAQWLILRRARPFELHIG